MEILIQLEQQEITFGDVATITMAKDPSEHDEHDSIGPVPCPSPQPKPGS